MSVHGQFRAAIAIIFTLPAVGRLLYHMVKPVEYAPKVLAEVLNNRNILMVGDSLMRYQYLALVHLLHEREFPVVAGHGDMLMEKKFASWMDFFGDWTKLLAPNELCDCHRDDVFKFTVLDDTRENRYYRDASRNLSVTYIQYFGDTHTLRGLWTPDETTGEMLPVKWEHNIVTFLENVHTLVYPKTTTLLLNAGFHPHSYGNITFRDEVMNLAKQQFPQVIWKTCNAYSDYLLRNDSCPSDAVMCGYPGTQCLDLSWTTYLSVDDYWNRGHFMAPIYDDINIQFLDLLRNKVDKVYTPLAEKNIIITDPHHKPPLTFKVDEVGRLCPFVPAVGSGDTAEQAIARCVNSAAHTPVVERAVETMLDHLLGSAVDDLCVKHLFHDGQLLRLSNERAIYLVLGGKRREFQNFGAFVRMGYDTDQVQVVVAEAGNELYEAFVKMPIGEPIV